MRTWLRSVVDTILGRVPGKTSRLDTATRMAMDADFSYRREPKATSTPGERGRNDEHLLKPIEASADIALFEQLVRVVNEAQERDAEDERRLSSNARRSALVFSTAAPRSPVTCGVAKEFVLAKSDVNRVSQQVVGRPGQIGDLGDKLRLDPMHAREHKRRAKAR